MPRLGSPTIASSIASDCELYKLHGKDPDEGLGRDARETRHRDACIWRSALVLTVVNIDMPV